MINIKNTKESKNMIDFDYFVRHTYISSKELYKALIVGWAGGPNQTMASLFPPLCCQSTSSPHGPSSPPTLWGCTDPHQTCLGGLMHSRYQLVSGTPSVAGKHTCRVSCYCLNFEGPRCLRGKSPSSRYESFSLCQCFYYILGLFIFILNKLQYSAS